MIRPWALRGVAVASIVCVSALGELAGRASAFLIREAQTAQPTVVLQGRVVRAGSDTPLANTRVVAAKVGGEISDYRTAMTGDSGQFEFRDLTPGMYRLHAQREGYLPSEHGKRPAGTAGVAVTLEADQRRTGLVIAMTPGGAISGRVLDDRRPLRRVWVRALEPTYFDGQRSWRVVEYAETDDRGEYRLFGLRPGAYLVSATVRARPRIDGDLLVVPAVPSNANGNRSSIPMTLSPETLDPAALDPHEYPPVYYGGTTDPEAATSVEVRAGETSSGVDLTIVRSATFSVRGSVTVPGASPDQPSAPIRVGVMSTRPGPMPETRLASPGDFELRGVLPGRYVVYAQMSAPKAIRLTPGVPIEVVDRDLENVAVELPPSLTVSGRVTIDGQPPAPGEAPVSVQLQGGPRVACCGAVRVQPDGTFSIANVVPHEYRFRVLRPGRPFWIERARFGTDDVLNGSIRVGADGRERELEIAIASTTATLDALAIDRDRQPLSGVLVILVPDGARRDRSALYRAATTGADGRVRIDGIAPGEYRVFASADIDAARWQDPNLIRLYESRGEIARFAPAATVTLTLGITP